MSHVIVNRTTDAQVVEYGQQIERVTSGRNLMEAQLQLLQDELDANPEANGVDPRRAVQIVAQMLLKNGYSEEEVKRVVFGKAVPLPPGLQR